MKRIWLVFYAWLIGDWHTKYMNTAYWVSKDGTDDKCYFKFQYSSLLNQWRLKTSGYYPKEHTIYQEYINNFHEYVDIISDPLKFRDFKKAKAELEKRRLEPVSKR